jgi:hypothetical protein
MTEPAWVCPDDGAPLNRGGWDKFVVDVYTNEARFTFACPHGGHLVDVIRDTKGGIAYKCRSYVPPAPIKGAVTPALAQLTPGIVIRVGKRKKR